MTNGMGISGSRSVAKPGWATTEQPIDLQAAIRADDEKNSAIDKAACEADQPTRDCDLRIEQHIALIIAKCFGCGFYSCSIPGSEKENEKLIQTARAMHSGQEA